MQPCEELMGMLSPCHFYALLEPKEIAENEKKHPPKEMLSIERANETFTLTPLGCRMFELCVKKPGHISLFKKSCQSLGGVTPLEVMVRIVAVCFLKLKAPK